MMNEIVKRKIEFLALGFIAFFVFWMPWLSIPFAILLITQCQSVYKNKRFEISNVVFLFLSALAIILSFLVIYHWSKDPTIIHNIRHGKIYVSGFGGLSSNANTLGTLNMLVLGVLCLVFRRFFAKEMQHGVHLLLGKMDAGAEPKPIFVIYITIFGVIFMLFAVWLLFREVLGAI